MGQIRKLIRDQEGVALIVALGAISIMVIIGVIVAALTMNNQKTVSHDKQQTAGRNIAEVGIDDAIARLPGPTIIPYIPMASYRKARGRHQLFQFSTGADRQPGQPGRYL